MPFPVTFCSSCPWRRQSTLNQPPVMEAASAQQQRRLLAAWPQQPAAAGQQSAGQPAGAPSSGGAVRAPTAALTGTQLKRPRENCRLGTKSPQELVRTAPRPSRRYLPPAAAAHRGARSPAPAAVRRRRRHACGRAPPRDSHHRGELDVHHHGCKDRRHNDQHHARPAEAAAARPVSLLGLSVHRLRIGGAVHERALGLVQELAPFGRWEGRGGM
jgi:hypothetical protein